MAVILIVDDEEAIRALWERHLQRWGYETVQAHNGRAGLELARRQPFDLVITDLTMPEMTGQELVYALKAELQDLEIIATTGFGTIELAVEMMKAGAHDFLTKPVNFGYAEMVIRNCLTGVEERRENARLRQEKRDLEELNELKEKFIAITSHELRTPVSVISNVIEMLVPELENSEAAGLLPLLGRSTEQLREVVGQMHELSAINSPHLSLTREEVPLAPLCADIIEESQFALEKRGHRVSVDIPAEAAAWVDRLKFKKVVRELVQNAIKFTPDNGTITLASEAADDGMMAVSVMDTGVGIPPDEREKIFHLFYEVGDLLHHHTSRDDFLGGGMGIGLAMVRDIVTAHGGRVAVESTLDGGSRFTVYLPQTRAP